MFRLLLALVIVGALSYWALRPHGKQNIMVRQITQMERTLSENGCRSASGVNRAPATAADERSEIKNLQLQIEQCVARSESPATGDRGTVDTPVPKRP